MQDAYIKSVSIGRSPRIRANGIVKLFITDPVNFDSFSICASFGHEGDGRKGHFVLIGSSRH